MTQLHPCWRRQSRESLRLCLHVYSTTQLKALLPVRVSAAFEGVMIGITVRWRHVLIAIYGITLHLWSRHGTPLDRLAAEKNMRAIFT